MSETKQKIKTSMYQLDYVIWKLLFLNRMFWIPEINQSSFDRVSGVHDSFHHERIHAFAVGRRRPGDLDIHSSISTTTEQSSLLSNRLLKFPFLLLSTNFKSCRGVVEISFWKWKSSNQNSTVEWRSVWPDLAIYYSLGNYSMPRATFILPKSLTHFRQFL